MNKLSNLLSLTECGFYDHLEEDGLFYLNMDVYCRSRRYSPLSFSKLSRLQNETDKKQERSFYFCCHEHVLETICFAPMNMCSKRCLLCCMVDLTRLKVPGFAGLKGLVVSRVPNLRVSGSRGMEGLPRLTGAF